MQIDFFFFTDFPTQTVHLLVRLFFHPCILVTNAWFLADAQSLCSVDEMLPQELEDPQQHVKGMRAPDGAGRVPSSPCQRLRPSMRESL